MKKIKVILKQNKIVYYIYNYTFSFILKIIGLFIKVDDKLILFNSFGGAKYDDSPRVIYEYMKKSNKYNDYSMIWVLDKTSLVDGLNIECVKNNSLKFFITALKAKYWITNSSMERGLKFKRKKTIYINTWHGSAFKLMGKDMKNKKTNYNVSKADYFYAQSNYDVSVFSKAYGLRKESIPIVGLPRNDELSKVSPTEINIIKNKLGISTKKKIILYAPTFREYCKDVNGCIIAPPINLKKWKKELSNEYIVLFRAHYEVNKVLNIETDDFIYNMTDYPNLNELLKISDILISDYSSIMIDFSILERPIFCYAYDYEEYVEKRGLYVDLNKELPNGICKSEDELITQIINCNFKQEIIKTKKFKNKYVEVYGNARKYVDEIILKG